MMKKVFAFFVSVSAFAIAAHAIDAVTPQVKNGCYEIGTAAELLGFANVVNVDGQKDACGKLTQSIEFNTPPVVTDGGLTNGTVPLNTWTPLQWYHGNFDGQGNYISGLYAVDSSQIGLIGVASEGTVSVKNLRIQDSYFAVDTLGMAAGIIGNTWKSKVYVDNCSFDGVVAAKRTDKYGNNFAGLVGNVSYNSSLVLTNSFNEGVIGNSSVKSYKISGLVAYVQGTEDSGTKEAATVVILNSYNAGSIKVASGSENYDSFIGIVRTGAVIDTNNVACISDESICKNPKSEADVKNAYDEYNRSKMLAYYDDESLKDLAGFEGVTFSLDESSLIAEISDVSSSITIPEDVVVDRVVIARTFTKGLWSTITFPFSAKIPESEGAAYALDDVVKEEGTWVVYPTKVVNNIEANKPYLIKIDQNGTGSLSFDGVTLKANVGATLESNAGHWRFMGVYASKKWKDGDPELGRAYGFAAEKNGSYNPGSFAKAGVGASIAPMRAYLLYTPMNNRPAAPGEEYEAYELPETIEVRIADSEGKVMEVLGTINALGSAYTVDHWYDVKGRGLGKKPSAKGAYLKNGKPVLVK